MPESSPRRGRMAEALRNDAAILDAARAVFVANPSAPIAAVAQRAGVGIGALYHRYQGKEELLASLCARGQDIYLVELERALASDREPWEALVEFLQRIVDEDTHSLVVRLAGTFTPTPEHEHSAARMRELSLELFARAEASGALRAGVTYLDVAYLLDAIAQSVRGDAERTAQLRRRQLAILIDGLRAEHTAELPGRPPTWEEQEARWAPSQTQARK